MPDVEIVKLKIRRGEDSTRRSVILEQGELGFTTDTERLWVGDGTTLGGTIVGNINHGVAVKTNITRATKGDIAYDSSHLYQLTGDDYSNVSDWTFIGTELDASYFEYDATNKVTLKDNTIHPAELNPDVVSTSGSISLNSTGLEVNVDDETVEIASNELAVKTVDENHINTTSFGNGLQGGSGSTIQLAVNSTYFGFNGTSLNLLDIPDNSVTFAKLDTNIIGVGLTDSNDQIIADIRSVDSSTIVLDPVAGEISLASLGAGSSNVFGTFDYDQYGRVTSTTDALAASLSASGNTTSHLSAFNGAVNQTVLTDQTVFDVTSNGTDTVSLTSAGFIQIETSLGKLAIPVFLPPQ